MFNCWLSLRNQIKKVDIFGILLTFRLNNKVKYRSVDGGIATIIFLIYSVFYALYLGVPFMKRKNIEFIYSNKIVQTQPYVNLTESEFNFAFGIQYQNDSTPALNDFEKYFHYSIILIESNDKEQINKYPFGIKKCVYENSFQEVYNQSFYKNNMNSMLCPIINSTVNFTLDGLFTDNYFKYVQLDIHLTDYGMNNLDEVRNLMQKKPIEMVIFFLDTGIDYQSRKKPLPIFINYINKGLDLYFLKTTELFFSKVEFTNDENLMINGGNTSIDSMLDKSEDSFHYIISRETVKETIVGKFILKASSKVVVLSRKYQKLPSFVGQLSGVIEQAYLIIFLIVTFIERQAIENKLIHQMLKMKGSYIYDMDYYLSTFHKEKINNNIMELIKKGNFDIEKTNKGGLGSKRKSQMLLLYKSKLKSIVEDEKNNCENTEKNNENKTDILNSKDKNRLSIIEEDPELIETGRNNEIQITNSNNQINNDNDEYYDLEEKSNNEKEKEKEEKENENRIKSYEKAEADFPSTSVLSIFFTYLFHCKCCNYQKRKYELIKKAKGKINYYIDIINYVKGMQEIDLFKYCLFDKEQIYILDYLAKPPFRISHKEIDCIYNEFEKDQYTFQTIGKKEIDNVYNAYNTIRNKDDVTFEDLKLLRLINAEVEYLS